MLKMVEYYLKNKAGDSDNMYLLTLINEDIKNI